MAIANKLQTVEDGCMDIRAAIQEKDNTKGHGAIDTLADDIRSLNSLDCEVRFYKDPNSNECGMDTKEVTSTSITTPKEGIEDKNLVAYINPSATTIAANAFANETSLEYVNFENIKTIGTDAFSGCSSLTMSAKFPSLTSGSFRNTYFKEILDLGKLTSTANVSSASSSAFYNCRASKIVFPETFTRVGQNTFWSNTYLKEAIFPSTTLVVIGRESFKNCTNLKTLGNLRISDFNGLQAFYGCTSLGPNLDFSNSTFTNFGYNAASNGETFCGCTSIVSVTLPTTCNFLSYRVLYGCSNLTTINGLERIVTTNTQCCMDCTKLGGELINSSLQSISQYSFSNCNFSKLVLPDIKTIYGTSGTASSGAFYSNDALTYVDLGPNCTHIGHRAFSYCGQLATFICRATTPPTLQTNVFLNTNSTFKIYVPYSADDSILNAYKEASNWSARATQIYSLDENGNIPT